MSDRALSTTMGYVLTLAITTALVTGLFVATGDMVQDREDGVVREELNVVGAQLAADIEAADRLARTDAERVVVETHLPERVAGLQYRIRVDPGPTTQLVLSPTSSAVSVAVPVGNVTDVRGVTVSGGDVRVVLAGDELEVRRA